MLFPIGTKKIPIHYVGKGFNGRGGMGQNSYIPLKLNSAGVMPVIFASVVMMILSAIVNAIPSEYTIKTTLAMVFSQSHPVYMIIYAVVIIFSLSSILL